jgi:CRISPR-associated protein Csm3
MAKLKDIYDIKGVLKVLESGLRIGASKENAGIGETDLPIIRNPLTSLPYVPGSSVKGKLRSLLELRHCPTVQQSGKPCACGDCLVCRLFGSHNSQTVKSPSRLLFRDSQPTEATQTRWAEAEISSDTKTEVLIDRTKNSASFTGPRISERIPAGSELDFSFAIRIFEGDKEAEFYEFLADGFDLLHKDYLGGFGSRGYGHVLFAAEDGRPLPEYLRERAAAVRKNG